MEPLYAAGHAEARDAVRKMSRAELFAYLDSLYGREFAPDDVSDNNLLFEALKQCDREFRNPGARPRWDFIEGYAAMMKADIAARRFVEGLADMADNYRRGTR